MWEDIGLSDLISVLHLSNTYSFVGIETKESNVHNDFLFIKVTIIDTRNDRKITIEQDKRIRNYIRLRM